MKYPWTGYAKLDRTCIYSYAADALRKIGFEYDTEDYNRLIHLLWDGWKPGRLRPWIPKENYEKLQAALREISRYKCDEFDAIMDRHYSEAELVAYQCEEGSLE